MLGRALHRLVAWATTLALGVSAVAFLFLAVGPHVLGYQTATMLTGSMAPGIAPGDVVVSVPEAAEDVVVGDVLSYHIPVEDHRVETHRVTRVTRDAGGRVSIVTKGDANNGVDPWVATIEGDTVWKTRFVVPHVGSAIRALREPLVQRYVFWAALAALVPLVLWRIWRPSGEGETT
ncbi:MAG TPA: signal peptidase I [Intrasporangium sp.]|uniref:signal peptidase I n=1 Tax=Intrasporangium sp. TaxID=1925024 RepID=UPI002D76DC4F|nr:signal peptidase I [Intrasporangium sp.]HET7399318.1 signal peptidase I [Intrasporangium sp.]